MGQLALPTSGTVYVDTAAVIYRVEQIEPYLTAGAPLWDAVDRGDRQVATSELTLLEVLVKPLRDNDGVLVGLYRRVLLETMGVTCHPIALAVLESAARLRAHHNLTTPDAIHAATAVEAGCALFVTNDPTFRRVPALNVDVLSEIAGL